MLYFAILIDHETETMYMGHTVLVETVYNPFAKMELYKWNNNEIMKDFLKREFLSKYSNYELIVKYHPMTA